MLFHIHLPNLSSSLIHSLVLSGTSSRLHLTTDHPCLAQGYRGARGGAGGPGGGGGVGGGGGGVGVCGVMFFWVVVLIESF